MAEDTQYDKKMKYKNRNEKKRVKPVKKSKKNKQRVKNNLNSTDFSRLYGNTSDQSDIDDFYWDED